MNQQMFLRNLVLIFLAYICFASEGVLIAEETRLLRQPTISQNNVAFAYGSDIWIVGRKGGEARRLTSTEAIEGDPHFSPDGMWIAFCSNRAGEFNVYIIPIAGGTPQRLTWYRKGSTPVGWSPDGKYVLYRSSRETAPREYNRMWKVSASGGPSELIPAPWAFDGSFSSDSTSVVIDRMSRWDSEWRHYRGGQNTPLVILDLDSLEETRIPNERSTDIQPIWMGKKIYFLSDRDWSVNIFSYDPATVTVTQLTDFDDVDIKSLDGYDGTLIFERDGYLHTFNTRNKRTTKLEITVNGDFPWAETQWNDVSWNLHAASLSPTGKRALFEARGEIISVPIEKGDTRNLTRSSGTADRAPIWSPKGNQIAWFSDAMGSYQLAIANQDGLSEPKYISIGESKMAWQPSWSPDGTRIAFVDDDVRIRVIDLESGTIQTADAGGTNFERGSMTLQWSPDSKWLAYPKTYPNNFRRIVVWSLQDNSTNAITDSMADATAPAWGRDGKHLYFLASTDFGLSSGIVNTSTIGEEPTYGVYAVVLDAEESTPFSPESDEEPETSDADKDDKETDESKETEDNATETAATTPEGEEAETQQDADTEPTEAKSKSIIVKIDFNDIDRRTIAIPMPVKRYTQILTAPEGSIFVAENTGESVNFLSGPDQSGGLVLHKFSLKKRKTKSFAENIAQISISNDGSKLLYRSGKDWKIADSKGADAGDAKTLKPSARMLLDRHAEWKQIFEEAWRYQRDYFYDPNMHGRDWDVVYKRYAPLLPFVRHRDDLNYILDQMNGELSVGHSFVWGGDMPNIEKSSAGLLGADLAINDGHWRIERIYTFESWNPKMLAPLDQPGLKVTEGNYLLGVNGEALLATDDPYRLLDGTADRQTVLRINDKPEMEGSWTIIVTPIRNEQPLRLRAWVEDNRRKVDELSGGKLAYAWIPNTSERGVVSFNRYVFAQQDKWGAVIDERYNGGGWLDDYMVDLMTRTLRAAYTNEVPNGIPGRIPSGILGPKVLLINELAGSGGDFFPWVFRQQKAGLLIGTRTWGGLTKSSVHYPFVDGGAMTAPDNAIFDPNANEWIAENIGVPPDIEVLMDAKSVAEGRDPQLERAVEELLKQLEENPPPLVKRPAFSTPAAR